MERRLRDVQLLIEENADQPRAGLVVPDYALALVNK